MPDFKKAGPADIRGVVTSALFFSLIWLILVSADSASWIIGGPAVLLAVAVSLALGGGRSRPVCLRGLLRFVPYFAGQSLVSGLDVLRRTFALEPRINPGMISYTTYLPAGRPRVFLANSISLMPGTLSADQRGELIVIHTLDVELPVQAGIQKLETMVALLFSLTPAGRKH